MIGDGMARIEGSPPILTGGRICPECGSNHIVMDYEVAEMVCRNCGLVISKEITDKGPEWRAFNKEQVDKRRRVGDPVTFTIHDKGLSTTIDTRNKVIHLSQRKVDILSARKYVKTIQKVIEGLENWNNTVSS